MTAFPRVHPTFGVSGCVRGGCLSPSLTQPATEKVQQLARAQRGDRPCAPSKFLSWSALKGPTSLASNLHSIPCPPAEGHRSRCHLWKLMGDNPVGRPKRTFLPVLTVLFLISYGLLATLVMEQGRTIDSQRSLIRALFGDSVQLSSLKGKAFQKQQAEARAQAQPQTHMKGAPAQGEPQGSHAQQSSPPQAAPRAGAKNHNTNKLRRPLPQRPPRDTADEGDVRRTLISI